MDTEERIRLRSPFRSNTNSSAFLVAEQGIPPFKSEPVEDTKTRNEDRAVQTFDTYPCFAHSEGLDEESFPNAEQRLAPFEEESAFPIVPCNQDRGNDSFDINNRQPSEFDIEQRVDLEGLYGTSADEPSPQNAEQGLLPSESKSVMVMCPTQGTTTDTFDLLSPMRLSFDYPRFSDPEGLGKRTSDEQYAECYRHVAGPYRTKTTVESLTHFAAFKRQFCELVQQKQFPQRTAYSSYMGGNSFAERTLIIRIWKITARLGEMIIFKGSPIQLQDVSVNGMESKVTLGICDALGCISVESITFERFISQESGYSLRFGACR